MATTLAPTRVRAGVAAPWVGLGAAVALMVLAAVVPPLLGWDVHARAEATGTFPPLSASWDPKVGVGTVPAVLLALLGWRYAVDLGGSLPWPRLLVLAYVGGLVWLLAIAYVDGPKGISRVLGNRLEYLDTARATHDVPAMLHEYVARIPVTAHDHWVTHVAGHPPGTLLFFVLLDRIGLGGDFAAGLVVTLLAATTSVAVLVALRALGAERVARRAAPFLVFGPAAVWTAVSVDAVFAAVAAWGLAALALGGTRDRSRDASAWSALAGLLLGYCVLMSYGLPLLGLLAIAVLLAARSCRPLPITATVASGVVLAFAVAGFRLWEAFPVLHERYWYGIAHERPASYWLWGNLAALCFSAGPLLGAGIGRLAVLRGGADRTVALLVAGAGTSVVLADLSLMSKAEVERIWLPFVPWLLLSVTVLPERWRRRGLAVQLTVALAVQHLLFTTW
jgi:hypothetical protein